ncbi:MAG: putative toxin-antitoxin system toxin component, PIN family [Methylococcales bacterium]|nr:putative toxin-antitoxin system toxin component, PIN family [Methylococcales bacterium]
MKIVLDTNILLVSIAKKSPYRIIFDSLLNNKFDLIISNDILREYTEIIAQKTNVMVATNISEMLLALANVQKQDVFYKWDLIEADKDDNKFVDCAIAGNADYLVSNDRHFNCLKNIEFPKLSLLNIDGFMDLLVT